MTINQSKEIQFKDGVIDLLCGRSENYTETRLVWPQKIYTARTMSSKTATAVY